MYSTWNENKVITIVTLQTNECTWVTHEFKYKYELKKYLHFRHFYLSVILIWVPGAVSDGLNLVIESSTWLIKCGSVQCLVTTEAVILTWSSMTASSHVQALKAAIWKRCRSGRRPSFPLQTDFFKQTSVGSREKRREGNMGLPGTGSMFSVNGQPGWCVI